MNLQIITIWLTVFYCYKKRRQLLTSVSLSDLPGSNSNQILQDLRRLSKLKEHTNQVLTLAEKAIPNKVTSNIKRKRKLKI